MKNFVRTTVAVALLAGATSAALPQASKGKPGTPKKTETLQWTNLDKAVAKAAAENKAVLIDVYTDWCGWCKKMDKETFLDPAVAAVLSSKFALAKVNGESKEAINFKGQKTDGIGIARGFGVRGYPAIIFLDAKSDMLTMLPGFLDAQQFLPVVMFIGERKYESMEWADYLEAFNKSKQAPAASPK